MKLVRLFKIKVVGSLRYEHGERDHGEKKVP